MIKFDYETYLKKYITKEEVSPFIKKKAEIIDKLVTHPMNGWLDHFIGGEELSEIEKTAAAIRKNSEVLVVIGIGGSYMGSFSVAKIFSKYFGTSSECEVIYVGYTLSTEYLDELVDYLQYKEFTINVISKSGTTMETTMTYKKISQLLKEKYSKDEVRKRIIVTTDRTKGSLREEVLAEGYKSFEIPNNIGGRYSIFTAANLLPLATAYVDIEAMIRGAKNASIYMDDAYYYATLRNIFFQKGKYIENFSVYEEKLYYFTEWIKQLFGESEGKDGKGIFPVSTVNTRDLHSLGQFLQEGNPIIYETILKVDTASTFNNKVIDCVATAHYKENTPSIVININNLKPYTIGELMYFFMMSAAFSAYLFDVDPFDQPGVEKYKREIKTRM